MADEKTGTPERPVVDQVLAIPAVIIAPVLAGLVETLDKIAGNLPLPK